MRKTHGCGRIAQSGFRFAQTLTRNALFCREDALRITYNVKLGGFNLQGIETQHADLMDWAWKDDTLEVSCSVALGALCAIAGKAATSIGGFGPNPNGRTHQSPLFRVCDTYGPSAGFAQRQLMAARKQGIKYSPVPACVCGAP